MSFVVGDIVRLKSGGPEMTVEATDAKTADVVCCWLAENQQLHSRFKSLTLRKIDTRAAKKQTLI